ncbi:tRNA pseudouridine synthase-like 1 [Lasioglossum baleicum]|uniref:tRNA pseudouridine synthase-like 1 n=1 Tax=Lasioglossum baleicum TaxID=434251 RepID=UPI003FCEE013
MQRYFIKFSYIGTHYRGLQKNGIISDYVIHDVDTVQGALECAFSTLIPKYKVYPRITTSSRTDVGVHAFCNAAHIDLHNKYDCLHNPSFVLHQVNRYLMKCHHDIKLLECIPVTKDFHARRLAKLRKYIYRFMIPKQPDTSEKLQQVPIAEKTHTFCFRSPDFDIERVKRGTKLFEGKKNYLTFCARSQADYERVYVKTLNKLTVEKSSPLMPLDPLSEHFDFWHIECNSRSFLYNQVRRIVTTLLYLGAGDITEKDIICMLQVPGHHNWNQSLLVVPPVGLHLVDVEYSQEEINQFFIKYKPVNFEMNITEPLNVENA